MKLLEQRLNADMETAAMVEREMLKGDDSNGGSGEWARPPLTSEQVRLLVHHLPLVESVARRIHSRVPSYIPLDDLASAGTIGLIDAAVKFEPEKGVSFNQYAQIRIRGAILDCLRSLDWGSKNLRQKSRMVREAIQTLTARLGRLPDEPEIAAEAGLTLDAYQKLLHELHCLQVTSLHQVRGGEESEQEEINFLPARPEESPLFACLRGELTERLATAINALPDREKTVITLYYYEEMSLREISLVLNVSEGRASQVHTKAVSRLKEALQEIAGFKSLRAMGAAPQSAFATC